MACRILPSCGSVDGGVGDNVGAGVGHPGYLPDVADFMGVTKEADDVGVGFLGLPPRRQVARRVPARERNVPQRVAIQVPERAVDGNDVVVLHAALLIPILDEVDPGGL